MTREIPEQDADLAIIGHVCGPERTADLVQLCPLRVMGLPPPVLCVDPAVKARREGMCSRCLTSPVSTVPRKGPPRRLCDNCTRIARETTAYNSLPRCKFPRCARLAAAKSDYCTECLRSYVKVAP